MFDSEGSISEAAAERAYIDALGKEEELMFWQSQARVAIAVEQFGEWFSVADLEQRRHSIEVIHQKSEGLGLEEKRQVLTECAEIIVHEILGA